MIKIIEGYAFTHDRFGYTLFETGVREKQDFKSRQKTGEAERKRKAQRD